MLNPDFSKLPINPLKSRREDYKLNVIRLSLKSGVSTQQIRDLEKGLPQTVPFGLMEFFKDKTLDVQYNNWRRQKRHLVYLPPVGALKISVDMHPFTQYRKMIGIELAHFCELICVPRFVVGHYEQNQKSMPAILKNDALPQAHLSLHDIARLANLGVTYYEYKEMQKNDFIRQQFSRQANS